MEDTLAKNIVTRRNLLKLAVIGGGAAAVGLYGIDSSGRVNYADPAYLYWDKNTRGALDLETYLVLCGSLAPSAHNTQPWTFAIGDRTIKVFADLERNLGRADKYRRMMLLSIGCALENIHIAASHLGVDAKITTEENAKIHDSGFCAEIALSLQHQQSQNHHLFGAIFNRQTTRSAYLPEPVSQDLKNAIETGNDFPDLTLHWFEHQAQRRALSELHRQAVRAYVEDQPAYNDSLKWWRYSRDELLRKRDGISIFTAAAPTLIKQYFQYAVDREDMAGDFGKQGEIALMDKLVAATPLWGAISARRPSDASRLRAGRLLERVYLEATQRDYRVMPMAYIPEQQHYAEKFKTLFKLPPDDELLTIYRIGRSAPCEKSVRRPLQDIIV